MFRRWTEICSLSGSNTGAQKIFDPALQKHMKANFCSNDIVHEGKVELQLIFLQRLVLNLHTVSPSSSSTRSTSRFGFREGGSLRKDTLPNDPGTTSGTVPTLHLQFCFVHYGARVITSAMDAKSQGWSKEVPALLVCVHYHGKGSLAGQGTPRDCIHRVSRPFHGILCASLHSFGLPNVPSNLIIKYSGMR